MMDSEHNLNYDGEPSPAEQAPAGPVLVNDSEGANYTVEEAQDWEEGPPDESAHYDPHEEDPYSGPEAFDDPYAETPFPDEYDDPYANTPYATDDQGQYVHDPYGELDYSGRPTADDLEDIDMSHRDPENIQGGEYELDSHDPKTQGIQAWLARYGKTAGSLASMVCLVTVMAAIIVVASSAGGNSHSKPRHADGSSSPWGLRKENYKQMKFVAPPLELETICTQENIATQDGFDACTVLCEPAQCCRFDPITEPKLSCQRGHVQDCHTYHHYCERPPRAAVIPFVPPPDNIHQLCTKEKMHTPEGVTDCARACQGGTCCRYPTSLTGLSCLRGNEEQCQVYHMHCEQPPSEEEEAKDEAMAETIQFPFVPPPSDITEKCSGSSVATSAGFGECLEICRSGTCCRFDPNREASLSCRNEHPSDCPIYDQYCGGNTNVVSSKPVHNNGETGISGGNPEKETYVEKVCSDHSLATVEGFADCQQACSEFECCWRKEFGSFCPTGTHCEPYSHCLAMEASDYMDVSIQVSINLKCTDELIGTQQGRRDCLLACSQATCCFGSKAGECPHADDSFCNQYDACEKVSEIHENVPPAPSNMGKVCEKEHLNTLQGLAECDRACSKATCCWQETSSQSSCEKTNPLCSDYAPCFILNEGTIVETYPPIPEAPATLEAVCSETDGDVTACSEFCQPAECCWKSGKCTHDQSVTCKGYAACAPLLGDIPDAPANLDQVCRKDLVDTAAGMAGCQSLCDPGACCWRTGACLGMHPETCEGYIPCAIIMSNDQPTTSAPSKVPEAPELIKETCTHSNVASADGEMLCADICKVAECCWKTGACLSTQPDICEGYVPCAALLDYNQPNEGSSSTVAAASPDVQSECTKEGVATANGRASCAAACKQAECCWKSGSCLGINADTCEGYSPCTVLLDDSISAAAPADLTEVCSRDNIETAIGAAACEAICEAADCCWKVGNCIAAQSDICEGYVPCAVLNENMPVTMPTAPSFLKDVCTQEKVQNVEGQILCQDACKVAECCWNTGTCLSTYPDQCEGYVPCAVLTTDDEGTTTATIPKAPSYLETVCGSEIAGDEVHGHLCVNACYRATCCWNPDSTTPCKNDPNCDAGYDICANVNFDTVVPPTAAPEATPAPVQGSTPAPAPTDGVDQGYSEEMITDACLNHDNSIVNLCAKVCAPSDCCFDRNGDSGESCARDFPCYKYSACAMLHPEEDYVDVACASDDLSDCVAACGDSTCCFTNDIEKTCAMTNPNMICSRYTACEKLYGFRGRLLRG